MAGLRLRSEMPWPVNSLCVGEGMRTHMNFEGKHMDALRKLLSALLATGALWVSGCATESVRLNDLAMKAMIESGKIEKERREIAAQPRSATEKSYTNPDHRWSVSYAGDWARHDTDRFVKFSRGQAVLGVQIGRASCRERVSPRV